VPPLRFVSLGIFFVGIMSLWSTSWTRSEAVDFDNGAFALRYSVAWGWGMEEAISVRWGWQPSQVVTVNSKIFDKPYNSGALIYVTDDREHYDIKLGVGITGRLFRYSPATHTLSSLSICDVIEENRARPKAVDLNGSRYFSGRIFLGAFRIHGNNRGEGVGFVAHDKLGSEPPLDRGECP
jgi:hypothetical protein